MLTREEVEEIFREHVPEGVIISFEPTSAYVRKSLQHPYIQLQMEMGLYDDQTIWTEFLSPACSYVRLNRLEVCYDLLENHAAGVPDDLTRAYITLMAAHEAHHFHADHAPVGVEEHALAERECVRQIMEEFPDLSDKVAQFEAQSATHQRVYERMRSRVVLLKEKNDRSSSTPSPVRGP